MKQKIPRVKHTTMKFEVTVVSLDDVTRRMEGVCDTRSSECNERSYSRVEGEVTDVSESESKNHTHIRNMAVG